MKKLLAFACLIWVIGWNLLWATIPSSDAFTDTNGVDVQDHSAGGITWVMTGEGQTNQVDCLEVSSNAIVRNAGVCGNFSGGARDTTNTYDGNHKATVTYTRNNQTDYNGPAVRFSTSNDFYWYYCNPIDGRGLSEWNNGAQQDLATSTNTCTSPVTLRLEANGTTLSPFENGSADAFLGTPTDATLSGGTVGFASSFWSGNGSIDDFAGDNLSSARRRQPIIGTFFWLRTSVNSLVNLPTVQAQPSRLIYLVPMDVTVAAGRVIMQPRYKALLCSAGCESVPYGAEPVYLVKARGIDATAHINISSQPGVFAFPSNLAANPSTADVAAMVTAFEAFGIPSGWVSTSLTNRQIIEGVNHLFLLMQRIRGIQTQIRNLPGDTRFLSGGVNLNSTIGSIPVTIRGDLQAASDAFGWDRTGITGATTIRQALRTLTSQWRTANGIIRIDQ